MFLIERSRYLLIGLVGAALLVLSQGCASKQDGPTRTEVMRQNLDPRVRDLLLEGEAAFQRGLYQQALVLADSAERYEPELADIDFFRGNVYMAINQLELARTAFGQALNKDPEFEGAWMRIGDLELERGDPNGAVQGYRNEAGVQATSELYQKLGRVYAESGIPDSARWAYEQAIVLDSANASAHMLYGQLLENLGDVETALVHSRKALAIRPESPNYRFAVGAQLFQLGRLEEARPYLKKAADAMPLHYPAQYNLGQVLMRLGSEEEADYYLTRADSTRRLLREITILEEAAAKNPGETAPLVRLGQIYQGAEMYDRAEGLYNAVIAVQPGNLDARHGLARLAMARGNPEDAIQRLRLVLFEDPDRVDALLDLGLAYAVTGKCEEAREAWNTVLERSPGNPTAEGYLAGLCQFRAN